MKHAHTLEQIARLMRDEPERKFGWEALYDYWSEGVEVEGGGSAPLIYGPAVVGCGEPESRKEPWTDGVVRTDTRPAFLLSTFDYWRHE